MCTLPKGMLGQSGVLWANQAYDFRGDVEAIYASRSENADQEEIEIGLKIGILANSDTLSGPPEKLPALYPPGSRMISLIHEVNCYGLSICHFEARRYGNLKDECLQFAQTVGYSLGGFQLVADWPEPQVVADLKNALPEKEFILQVGRRALEEFAIRDSRSDRIYYADEIALKVEKYTNHISEVVICPSSPNNPDFNPQKIVPVVEQLMMINNLRLSISTGKLTNVPEIFGPLVQVCPYLGYNLDLTYYQPKSDHLHFESVYSYMEEIIDVIAKRPSSN